MLLGFRINNLRVLWTAPLETVQRRPHATSMTYWAIEWKRRRGRPGLAIFMIRLEMSLRNGVTVVGRTPAGLAATSTLSGEQIAEYGNATTYFIHKDQLGSTRLMTDINGNDYDLLDFLPFGEQAAGDTGRRTSSPAKNATPKLTSTTSVPGISPLPMAASYHPTSRSPMKTRVIHRVGICTPMFVTIL